MAIEERVVLVLGAGASAPYGFPIGGELVRRICNDLAPARIDDETPRASNDCAEVLLKAGYSRDLLRQFGEHLCVSAQPSIDDFLAQNPGYADVGKAAIAASLIPFENQRQIVDPNRDNDWYRLLFNRLYKPRERICHNRALILTYNYDRSCEAYMRTALQGLYGLSAEEAFEASQAVSIIHLHGTLGDQPYGNSVVDVDIREVAGRIQLMSTNDSERKELRTAKQALAGPDRICFLGCGYHESNLDALQLSSGWPADSYGAQLNHEPPRKDVEGTAYRLSDRKQQWIRKYFSDRGMSIQLGGQQRDIFSYLSEQAWFAL